MTPYLIKRLELLKNLIALEEWEMVTLQAEKLAVETSDSSIREIVSAVREEAFGEVGRRIENFLKDAGSIQIYEDPEIQGLRIEVRLLEQNFVTLREEKSESERQIHAFQSRYQQALGDLIAEVLRLRMEQRQNEAKENSDKQSEFEEARQAFENQQKLYEESQEKPLPDLNKSELAELKRYFREAVKLCHPDVVAEEFREQGADLFRQLSVAHEQHDLETVRSLLDDLKRSAALPIESDFATDKERLRMDIERLRRNLSILENELVALKTSETWQTISGMEDWDTYFSEAEKALQTELEELQKTT
jgi:hypothetical protein